jgi:hypothetical protein
VTYFGTSDVSTGLTFRQRQVTNPDLGAAAQRLEAARKRVEELESRGLNPNHPDVVRARQDVLFLEEASANTSREFERAVNQLGLRLNQLVSGQGQMSNSAPIPADVRPTEEQLGTRQIEGVKATGRRTTAIIPTNRVGNDRPITITDERWESPELRLVVYSRFSDPRTGVVEFRLTGINRTEPRADLFTVPPEYTVIATPGLRIGAPAQGGGRGQRGGAPQQ